MLRVLKSTTFFVLFLLFDFVKAIKCTHIRSFVWIKKLISFYGRFTFSEWCNGNKNALRWTYVPKKCNWISLVFRKLFYKKVLVIRLHSNCVGHWVHQEDRVHCHHKSEHIYVESTFETDTEKVHRDECWKDVAKEGHQPVIVSEKSRLVKFCWHHNK